MIVIHVSVKAKQYSISAFERALRDVVADARQIAGCVKYEWYRTPDSPEAYAVYGEFASREVFDAYLRSPAVERIGAELLPLLAAEPEFKHFQATLFEGSQVAALDGPAGAGAGVSGW